MKYTNVQIDYEALKRLRLYRVENSTEGNQIKIKDLVTKAVNEALENWELNRLEEDDHK